MEKGDKRKKERRRAAKRKIQRREIESTFKAERIKIATSERDGYCITQRKTKRDRKFNQQRKRIAKRRKIQKVTEKDREEKKASGRWAKFRERGSERERKGIMKEEEKLQDLERRKI